MMNCNCKIVFINSYWCFCFKILENWQKIQDFNVRYVCTSQTESLTLLSYYQRPTSRKQSYSLIMNPTVYSPALGSSSVSYFGKQFCSCGVVMSVRANATIVTESWTKRFVSDRWWTVDKRWTDFWGGAPYTCILSDGWWGDSSCGKAALLTSDFIKHLRFHRDPVLNQAVLW